MWREPNGRGGGGVLVISVIITAAAVAAGVGDMEHDLNKCPLPSVSRPSGIMQPRLPTDTLENIWTGEETLFEK
jgi:hypothetical protein